MKRFNLLTALFAAACMAVPVSGYGAFDHPGGRGGRGPGGVPGGPGGGPRGGPAFHGGRFGGPGHFRAPPFFWGPALGFTFYDGPPYYYYYDETPDTYYYRGVQRSQVVNTENLSTDVQRALAHRGYYHGAIDGEIGSGSRAAIRAYQSDHGLTVTGRIDHALLRSLGID